MWGLGVGGSGWCIGGVLVVYGFGCMLLGVRREPVVVGVLALDSVVAAGLAGAVALGWLELSAEQVAAVVGFVAVVSGVVAGVVRGRVTPDADGVWDEGYTEGFDDGLFMPVPAPEFDPEFDPAFVPAGFDPPDDTENWGGFEDWGDDSSLE